MSESTEIILSLGRDEAIVLFELLVDFQDQSSLEIKSPSERLSLIRLSGALEGSLPELFAADYKALLEEARLRLNEEFGVQRRG